jgi:hypothetical protein
MGDLVPFPMTYCSLDKGERSVSLVWAESSKRVLYVKGDLPPSWIQTDATLAVTRLISAGWTEVARGKVEDI